MNWYKIDNYHRPEKGHAIYIAENPEEGGIAYHVKQVDDLGFWIVSADKTSEEFIPYDSIENRGNVYAWDRNRIEEFPEFNPEDEMYL